MIYCHSWGGARIEGKYLIWSYIKLFNIIIFDFWGSGYSDGNHITLGINESEDLESVIKYLKNNYKVEQIGIYGWSMGAVTAIIHNNKYSHKEIDFLVLDSPFTNFNIMIWDLIWSWVKLPNFVIKQFLLKVQKYCLKRF